MKPAVHRKRAFTIVELVVVMAILSMLCAMLVRLTGHTQSLVGSNMHRMDSDGQAQLSFDRIALDFSGVPEGDDLPWVISNSSDGSPILRFLSNVPAETGSRKLSMIAYRVAKDTSTGTPLRSDTICLQRVARGIEWNQNVMGTKSDGKAVTFDDLSSALPLADTDYDILATGVIRAAISCQRRDTGAVQASVPLNNANNPDLARISGIVITLVVLDAGSLELLTPAQVDSIATLFPAPVDGALPGTVWSELANHPENFAGIPGITAQSLRVYQRFFPVRPVN